MIKRYVSYRVVAGFFALIPALALPLGAAQGEGTDVRPPPTPVTGQTSPNTPPIEQALVPEGVLAMRLVEALKLGQAQDEAEAERLLSTIGIEPKNGWITEYPVTPPLIGEIETSVAAAAEAAKLGMGKDEALKAVGDLKTRLGLNVTPGAISPAAAPSTKPPRTAIYKYTDKDGIVHYTNDYESIPKEYRERAQVVAAQASSPPSTLASSDVTQAPEDRNTAIPTPEAVNDYYYGEGPPVVTYYPPPLPYDYLYSWIPYPFWYTGFYFPGFFILHDFHRHFFFHGHRVAVTDHVAVRGSRRLSAVDPVRHSVGGGVAPKGNVTRQAFDPPRTQSSARMLFALNQSRFTVTPRLSPVLSMTGAPLAARERPSPLTGQRNRGRNSIDPVQVLGSRTVGRPIVARPLFVPPKPRAFAPPSFSRGPAVRLQWAGSGSSLGGMHGGQSVGGGSISSRGGSRGGHR